MTNRFYPTNANDQILTNFAYKTGTLGGFYQATNSVLLNIGSRNATNAGLYHYTVTTNFVNGQHVKETNSVVDIGFHYVAVDTNGVPIDTDGDTLPDYLEARNGNGSFDPGESNWNNPAPTVSITAPTNGQLFVTSPTNITVTATASDADGVTNPLIYQGTSIYSATNLVGQAANTNSLTVTWSNVTAGIYTLVAKATDGQAGSRFSAPVSITVNAMPGVSITNPANGAYFLRTPTNITLSASASDSD